MTPGRTCSSDRTHGSARLWVAGRISDAIGAVCHPPAGVRPSVGVMDAAGVLVWGRAFPRVRGELLAASVDGPVVTDQAADPLVVELFAAEGSSLVRLARLFVDDRNAAEDLVQEAFIRLARNVGRIQDRSKAPAYLRSIVLNLARDHNRRGLVSLRHYLPFDAQRASTEDAIVLREDRQQVLDALRELSARQRACLVLRYYDELGIDEIADVLSISRNSVKTHLTRGLTAMEGQLRKPGTTDADEVDR